ncbi:hypothetical protein D3C84_991630 [compost metagenome]
MVLAQNEPQVVFAQVVVVEDGGEHEQCQSHADEDAAPIADHRCKRILGQYDAVTGKTCGVEAR